MFIILLLLILNLILNVLFYFYYFLQKYDKNKKQLVLVAFFTKLWQFFIYLLLQDSLFRKYLMYAFIDIYAL